MPNVKITEQDLTRAGTRAVNRDIVYIPGFPGVTHAETTIEVNKNVFTEYVAQQDAQEQTAFAPLTRMYLTSSGWKYVPADFPNYSTNVTSPISTTMASSDNAGNGISISDAPGATTPVVDAKFTSSEADPANGAGVLTIGKHNIDISSSSGFAVGLGTVTNFTVTPIIPVRAFPDSLDLASNAMLMYLVDLGDSQREINLESDSEYTQIREALIDTVKQDYYGFTITKDGTVNDSNLTSNAYLDNKNLPILCETIGDFQTYFGETPYQFADGEYDKSYIEAIELINRGLPVLYHVPYTPTGLSKEYDTSIDNLMAALKAGTENDPKGLRLLVSKSDYDVKYITTGAYNSYNFASDDSTVASVAVDVAKQRGDAFAIIDHESGIELSSYMPVSSDDSLLSKVSKLFSDNGDDIYATMFTPWYKYNASYMTSYGEYITVRGKEKRSNVYLMPPSFAYLCSLAESIKFNPNWYAIAGVNRGIVPGFNKLEVEINNTVANAMQARDGAASINAITYIRPYGYAIWGNRTLKDNAGDGNLTATSFLNIRNMLCDIKKVIREVGFSLLFEQDTPTLWINFVAGITPTLERMRGTGLSNYRIIRERTDEKAKIKATLRIYPIYSVEDFEINIELRDEEVIVE